MKPSIKEVGHWDFEVEKGLQGALAVSMNVIGKTGEQAVRQAMIFMAQSAGALATPHRRKTRPVLNDGKNKYVEVYSQKRPEPKRIFQWMFDPSKKDDPIPGTWQNARKIGAAGLAGRSWMWGLRFIGRKGVSKAVAGASRFYTVTSEKVNGYVKENRLSYILKTMPAGWERTVESKTENRILGNARNKLEREWQRAVVRRQREAQRAIGVWFKK